MISEPLYKTVTEEICTHYKSEIDKDLDSMICPVYEYKGNIRELMEYKDKVAYCLQDLKSYTVPQLKTDISGKIRQHFQSNIDLFEEKKRIYNESVERFKEASREEYEAEVLRIKDAAQSTISSLVTKHSELLEMKDKLRGVMEHYGITPGDITISPDITREEFEALLDSSLEICNKFDSKVKGLLKKLTIPFDGDNTFAIVYSFMLFLVSWLFLPFIAIGYTVAILKNTSNMYHNIDKLRIAESLMHSVDFDKFIPKDSQYEIPEFDEAGMQSQMDEGWKDVLKYDPQPLIEAELRKYSTDEGLAWVAHAYSDAYDYECSIYKDMLTETEDIYETTSKLLDDELANIKRLGEDMNTSTVMDTQFIVGYYNEKIPIKVDYGLTNMNFVGNYTDEGMRDLIKMMFVNIFLSIRANALEVTIFDPEYLGQAFAEFITPKTNPYIKIASEDVSKVIASMQKQASANILACKTDSILDFNRNAESLGMVTRQYYLYILLTGLGDKFTTNKAMMELLKYSAEKGIIVWTVYPENIESCLNIPLPFTVAGGDPVQYDFALGSTTVSTFEYALEHNKRGALDYRKGYLLKYLPSEKWWVSPSTKGINIRFGLENGDPAKAFLNHFDDKNVHCLLAGATGAGKSVAIDCTLQSMLHEYAPDEFQLVYIDMKNAEVAKYTKDGVSIIPHAIIVAGTTDGEYCLSIFDWALEEMTRRLAVCRDFGVQKVEDLRKKYDDPSRPDYDPRVHIPRTLILIDEFQVMFDTSRIPSRIVDKIGGRITSLVKLARAASMHLWFTSQEMSGTLSKNVLDNFSTRGALRCTKDVSSQILGNPAAGTIREKNGWMYSNDSAGQDPNANKMWRVPYAPIDDLMQGIYELQEKAEKENRMCLHAKFFDEKEGRTDADLKEAYVNFPAFEDPHFFVMGERTVYSTRPTPFNFRFVVDDKENLLCAAFERQDTMDLIGTFIDNILMSGDKASLLINSADKDTTFLLNLQQYMREDWIDFLDTGYDIDDILDDLDGIAEDRAEMDPSELKPLYIFCLLWEKKDRVGQNEAFKVTDRLSTLIKTLNAYDVHFIFVCRENGLPRSLVNLCNHKICAKADERTCIAVIDEVSPFKFPGPSGDEACFAIYKYGSDMFKFKIYRHKLERQLEERQL